MTECHQYKFAVANKVAIYLPLRALHKKCKIIRQVNEVNDRDNCVRSMCVCLRGSVFLCARSEPVDQLGVKC